MKKIINEFKQFAVKGNVIELAVGVVIGTAFGKVVSSLVNDIIMPPIGYLLSGIDFAEKAIVLKEATETSGEVLINYGLFVNAILSFLITAWAIFLAVKVINKMKKEEEKKEEKKAGPSEEVLLLQEIRDALKKKS